MRKKVMGLADIHLYDLYTPLLPGVTMTFPFEEAQRLLPEPWRRSARLRDASCDAGSISRAAGSTSTPIRNKESGAFSSAIYRVHPFVKINYLDQYDDLSTLAHEMGHACIPGRRRRSSRTSPRATSRSWPRSPRGEREAAVGLHAGRASVTTTSGSTCQSPGRELRTTIYRQTLFAEFELLAHDAAEKGTPLTAEFLDATYRGLVARYYGPDLTIDPNDATEWGYIPHFFYKYLRLRLRHRHVVGGGAGRERALRRPEEADAISGCWPPARRSRRSTSCATRASISPGPTRWSPPARLMDRTIKEMQAILAKKAGR